MCWISAKPPIGKVAKKDKKVYKVLSVKDGMIYSPIWSFFKWKIGLTEKADIRLFADQMISSGLHSFSRKPYKKRNKDGVIMWTNLVGGKLGYYPNDMLFECVIPKGSIYYENEYGECVSDHLKPVKQL